jgi:molybdenum cofactor cytidylyltransferase
MGRPKALLPLGSNETFLTRIVRTLLDAEVDDVVIVVGHEAGAIVDDFARSGLPARFVENPNYDRGQLTSLIVGLNLVDRPGVTAALVTLVDVPLVSSATVRAVRNCFDATHAAIVRPSRGSVHGHPILIDRSLFELLRHANPSEGAKPIVRAHASREGDIEVNDAGAFTDIDTPFDYQQAVKMSPSRVADPLHESGSS